MLQVSAGWFSVGMDQFDFESMKEAPTGVATLFLGRVSGAAVMLASVRPVDGVVAERKRQAQELLKDLRRLDVAIKDTRARITVAVKASETTLTDIYGVGPVVAALVIGHAGPIGRFTTRHQFASYNGTAPIEASSEPTKRHRLNPPVRSGSRAPERRPQSARSDSRKAASVAA